MQCSALEVDRIAGRFLNLAMILIKVVSRSDGYAYAEWPPSIVVARQMIPFELLHDTGKIVVVSEGTSWVKDVTAIAAHVAPYIVEKGPTHEPDRQSAIHCRMEELCCPCRASEVCRDHHRKIVRVAIVTDSRPLKVAQTFADHLSPPEIELFKPEDDVAAPCRLKGARG